MLDRTISLTWGNLTKLTGLELALMLQITGLLQSSLCTTLALTRNEQDRTAIELEQDRRRDQLRT